MKITRGRWVWALAGIAAIAATGWAFAPRPVQVEVAAVTEGVFEQSVEEDGQTRLKDRYTISAPVAARMARITLREGDSVAAGDVVAVLAPAMSSMLDERSAREAAARLEAAIDAVALATAGVERADIALQEAWLELQRTNRLAEQGFVAPARVDTARLAVSSASRALQAAKAQQRVAEHERTQAEVMLQPATGAGNGRADGQGSGSGSANNTGAGDGTRPLAVRSPVAGVVLRIPAQSEGTVAAGAPLLDVGDTRQLEVVAELLTTDAVQARPGTPVVIERWGGPAVQGRVRRVEPAAFTKISALGIEEQRVKVLIDTVEPPPAWQQLGDGFRVGVRVITQRVQGARLVPVGALFPYEGEYAVFALESGRARLRTLTLRGRNASLGWVEGAPPVGTQVIVYPPANVEDGTRVKVRAP